MYKAKWQDDEFKKKLMSRYASLPLAALSQIFQCSRYNQNAGQNVLNHRGSRGRGFGPIKHIEATPQLPQVIYYWPFQCGTSVVVTQCYMLLCPCVYGLQLYGHLINSWPLCFLLSRKENPQKLTQLSPRSHPRHLVGKKDSTKRRHQRHHKRQPGEQLFPTQVVTG